jgi:hypothetical protein
MIPNDTALASFVRDFGDSAMSVMISTFYEAPLVKLLIYATGVIMFVLLGYSIHRGTYSKFIGIFWLSWIAIVPINQKPLLYVAINTFSELSTDLLHKFTYNLLTSFGTKNAIPPGFVFNVINRSAFAEITDQDLKENIRFLISNCIPSANNLEGKPFSANDLFSVKVRSSNKSGIHTSESLEYNFDPNLLKVRTFDLVGQNTNCLDLLNSTLHSVRSHLRSKDLGRQEQNPSEIDETRGKESNDYKKLNEFALNLAHASAIHKQVVKDYFPEASTSMFDTIDGTVAASTSDANFLTGIPLAIMNTPKAIARSLNIDGVLDNASKLHEINEKILNLPYYTSYLQVILKIIVPLAILTMFSGTLKWIKYWSLSWSLSLVLPWFLYISRTISNSILIWALKLNELTPKETYASNYLLSGVSFDATSKVLEDTSRMMSVFLQCELALWGSLFVIIPFSSWLVGQAGNFMNRMGSSVTGTAGGTVVRNGTDKLLKAATAKAGSQIGSIFGPMGTIAGSAASTLTTEVTEMNSQKDENEANHSSTLN